MKKTTTERTGTATRKTTIRGAKHVRSDSGDAFFPDPGDGPARARDPLAQELAEEYLTSATTAEESAPDRLDQSVAEDDGGPFVLSPASREFAEGVDGSNPNDAEAEPLPSPMRGVR